VEADAGVQVVGGAVLVVSQVGLVLHFWHGYTLVISIMRHDNFCYLIMNICLSSFSLIAFRSELSSLRDSIIELLRFIFPFVI
jgi:hypothetical protein